MTQQSKAISRLRRYLHQSTTKASIIAVLGALSAETAYAQVTFSTIGGEVKVPDGMLRQGIRVEITHLPSGSRSTVRTNAQGRFNATGLRVGGPYQIRFFGPQIQEKIVNADYAAAGEVLDFNVELRPASNNVEEVVVLGEAISELQLGSFQTFDARRIRKTPVLQRNIQEIARLDARAFVDLGQPDEEQGISILGFNTRFNSIVADGISLSDTFGDNFTGLTTRRSPISLDAIESLSVESAPFDVQNSGFQGGQVNIITKSGSNDWHGSAFYQRSGGFLSGDFEEDVPSGTTFDPDFENPAFTASINKRATEDTFGATLGGPIIKDKLFFFFSYEEFTQDDDLTSCPSGFVPECENPNPDFTLAEYLTIQQTAIDLYGFDPGDFADVNDLSDGERKFLGKIDWNIVDGQRLSVTFQNTTSNSVGPSGGGGLGAPANFTSFERDVPQLWSVQLFSDWTPNFSTQARFGFTRTESVTNPLFDEIKDVGFVRIDGVGSNGDEDISLTVDDDDQLQALEADRFQYKLRAEYIAGRHTISAGYERDARNIFDLRIPGILGDFIFDGFDNFAAGQAEIGLAGAVTGVPEDAASQFSVAQNSFYIQDVWDVTSNLTLLFGLRYERFETDDVPQENPFFIERNGFSNTATLAGVDAFLPRFSFNYQPFERTTLRGGIGMFAGGVPLTWIAESFRFNGVNIFQSDSDGELAITSVSDFPPEIIDGLAADADLVLNNQSLESSVSFLDPDFEIPRNLRFHIGFDQFADLGFLGDNWKFTVDFYHSEIIQAIQFQDVRLQDSGTDLPGLEGIPRYFLENTPFDARTARPFTQSNGRQPPQDIMVTNTSNGFSTVVAAGIEKLFDFGSGGQLLFSTNYAFTRTEDLSPANDTDDLDDVFETGAYDDINDPTIAPSIQATPHNLTYTLNYRKEWENEWAVTFSVFGNYRTGRAVSFVYDEVNNDINGGDFDDPNFPDAVLQTIQPGLTDRAQSRLIPYLPTGPDDPLVRYVGGASFEQLQAIIDAFDLARFQGGPLPRNEIRSDDAHQINLNMQVEIPTPTLPGKLFLEAGINNFLNLLDRDRGLIRRFSIRENLFDAAFDASTNQYVISTIDDGNVPLFAEQRANGQSVWSATLGLRYVF